MAIAPTGAIFQKLIFGSVDSSDYGIYITGQAVYNAPKRAVEVVSVPGRNGAVVIDQGRWDNLEVSYPAGCFADNQGDFATNINRFRNAICSQLGYQRLTDTYNPNEYRIASYVSGLDVTPKSLNQVGEFKITFNCKPQRFLVSGETEVTVGSGDTLTNPTQYPSNPLLMVKGDGTVSFNGYEVVLEAVTLGNIVLTPSKQNAQTISFDSNLVNAGDTITLQSLQAYVYHNVAMPISWLYAANNSIAKTNADCAGMSVYTNKQGSEAIANFEIGNIYFTAGTAGNIVASSDIHAELQGGAQVQNTHKLKVAYDGNDTIFIEWAIDSGAYSSYIVGNFGELRANSSVSALGNPTYIDCDIGECYLLKNGNPVSLNGVISLGSDLPELASGANTITFDNTITDLKVVPRWWEL